MISKDLGNLVPLGHNLQRSNKILAICFHQDIERSQKVLSTDLAIYSEILMDLNINILLVQCSTCSNMIEM